MCIACFVSTHKPSQTVYMKENAHLFKSVMRPSLFLPSFSKFLQQDISKV